MAGSMVVISGPSGCGKSSLIQKILQEDKDIYFSISTTTRQKRDQEIDGKDYFFITEEEFENGIKNHEFLEWAKVHQNYYGTSLKQIQNALDQNKLVLFDIDVQGHKNIKKIFPDICISVFIITPTKEELKKRLLKRQTDSIKHIQTRLQNAQQEIKEATNYDFFLINDDFEETFKKFKKIIEVAKLKKSKKEIENFIKKW